MDPNMCDPTEDLYRQLEDERNRLRASLAAAEERAAKAEREREDALRCSGENAKAWQECVEESAIKRTHLSAEIGLGEQQIEQLASQREDLATTVAGLRGTIETLLKSAVPHPVEHPTMTAAWKIGTAALNAQPHESLTRFVARVQEDALKAAVESLKGERRKRGEELEKAEHELEESLKDCVAVLTRRSGRGFDPEVRWGDIIQQTIDCSYKALAAIQAARAAK